jgi:scytalone dehydratase
MDGKGHILIIIDLDYLAICNVAFEWAESYDTKDWDRLRQSLAPSIRLDFRSLQGALQENLSPDDFVATLAGPTLLGDKTLKTQHLIGGAKWEVLSDGTVQVSHQIRVAHQRYTTEDLTVVANKGHAHGVTQHWFRKIDGFWKLEGVAPKLEFYEYDLFGTLNPKLKEDANS